MRRLPWLLSITLAACADEAGPPAVSFDGVDRGCDAAGCLVADLTDEEAAPGRRLIHARLAGSPLTTIRFVFDGGSRDWSVKRAHAEAMLFRVIGWWGSARRPGPAFEAELSRIGAGLSARQGLDFSHLSITAPTPHFAAAWGLLRDALLAPPLPDEEALVHVRGVHQNALESSYEDASTAAIQSAWDLLYTGHPYNLRLETVAQAAAITPRDVAEAAEALLHSPLLNVVVVGDVEAARVRRAIVDELSGPLDEVDPAAVPAPRPSDTRAEVLDYPESPSWHVRGYFPAPAPDADDYLALRLGLSVLDDRLFDELRTARALVYTTGAGLSTLRANNGAVWLSTDTPEEALAALHQVLAALQADGPDAQELDAARAQYRTAFHADNDDSAGLSWTLSEFALVRGGLARADAHLDALEAVTRDEVVEALRSYLPELRLAAAGAGAPLTEAMLLGP